MQESNNNWCLNRPQCRKCDEAWDISWRCHPTTGDRRWTYCVTLNVNSALYPLVRDGCGCKQRVWKCWVCCILWCLSAFDAQWQLRCRSLFARLRDLLYFVCRLCVGGRCWVANWMVGESAFVMAAQNSGVCLIAVYSFAAPKCYLDSYSSLCVCVLSPLQRSICLYPQWKVEKPILGSELKACIH